jgi:tetratricopeptide (TPR) repeat protein
MAITDRFGLPLTTQSAPAAESYGSGVDLLLSANTGGEALLDAAIELDPEFALAHIARARLCQMQARMPEAKEAAAKARGLRKRVSRREQGTIEAIALTVDGAGPQAMAYLEAHVADYPRDALALSLALGVFGLLGFSGRLDHHEAQLALLERLAPQWDEDWWFLTYLGWARIETGDVAAGAREVERALVLNPHNAFAAHARAHGYFEAGDADSGRRVHCRLAARLRPPEPAALPPVVASRAVRVGARPAATGPRPIRGCDPAGRLARASFVQFGRCGVLRWTPIVGQPEPTPKV